MKNILTSVLSLLLTVTLFAQQVFNDPHAEVRDVKGFRGVRVGAGIKLVVSQGNTEAVAISAPTQQERDNIKTVVENGILKIYYDQELLPGRSKIRKNLRAYVSVVNVEFLGVASGASLETDGEITGGVIDLRASSGGMMKATLKAQTLSAIQSSGGLMRVAGTADYIRVESSSGGVFEGYDLTVDKCYARSNSGGIARVTVNNEIEGRASSGGIVSYKGNPKLVSKKANSGGRVSRS